MEKSMYTFALFTSLGTLEEMGLLLLLSDIWPV